MYLYDLESQSEDLSLKIKWIPFLWDKTYFDFTKVQVAKRIRYSCSL